MRPSKDAFSIISIVESMRNLRCGARGVRARQNRSISTHGKKLRKIL